jgi:hypothetical protein
MERRQAAYQTLLKQNRASKSWSPSAPSLPTCRAIPPTRWARSGEIPERQNRRYLGNLGCLQPGRV